MADLQFGRITIPHAEKIMKSVTESNAQQGNSITFEFDVLGATLADTMWVRRELEQMVGSWIEVKWTDDPTFPIFGQVAAAAVTLDDQRLSYLGSGEARITMTLVRLPFNHGYQSRLTGGNLLNNHGLAPAKGFIAPPIGAVGTSAPAGAVSLDRTGAKGDQKTYVGIASGADPIWEISAGTLYDGGCYLETDSRVREGLRVPDTPTDWTIRHHLIRASSAANGGIEFEWHDGTTWQSVTFDILLGASAIGDWTGLSVLANRPEWVSIRLVQPRQNETGRMELDLTLRRGSRYVAGRLKADSTINMGVERAVADSAVNATGYVRDDAAGDQWMVICPITYTADTTQGGLNVTSQSVLPFALGVRVDSGETEDAADNVRDQFISWRSEQVLAVAR